MVKRLATSPHDPLGITDSACKNQSVVVSVLYGPFNPYIPIRSSIKNLESSTCVTLNGSGIQLAVGPQPLRLRNHNSGLSHRIMVRFASRLISAGISLATGAIHFDWFFSQPVPVLTICFQSRIHTQCLPAFYEIDTTQILLAEPLGSLAFKMVQVRQLMKEQQVELESADG
ncbi:hypothetical protein F511_27424 [Dorcoceras hygrometricum]|uniref:Uncharacterized protein n=1 Tax=Dorcoceras hygrometricum TaxID=472368 RepID=A0A2Z7BQR7_9LAMI|nr:hypothetical protein F511_27424 [Dorcoceras hygrometricum]